MNPSGDETGREVSSTAVTCGVQGERVDRSGPPLIRASGVWKIFGAHADRMIGTPDAGLSRGELRRKTGCVIAVRDVSIEVWPGEVFVVMGLALSEQEFRDEDGYAMHFRAEEDRKRKLLIRDQHLFVREGELYRRVDERHILHLIEPDRAVAMLKRAGFSVRQRVTYPGGPKLVGWRVFLAAKPKS